MAVTFESLLPQSMSDTETDPQFPIPEIEPDETNEAEDETQPDSDGTDDSDDDINPDDTDTFEDKDSSSQQVSVSKVDNAHVFDEIRHTEAICGQLEDKIGDQKERLKETKKEYDAACIRLRKLCRSLTESMPLFDQKPKLLETPPTIEFEAGPIRIARGELNPEHGPMWVEIVSHPDFSPGQILKVAEYYDENKIMDLKTEDGERFIKAGDMYVEMPEGTGEIFVQMAECRILDYYEEDLPEQYVIVDSLPIESKRSDNEWRATPIGELKLMSLKGFGVNKYDALVIACPTLGHLEDLRAKASTEHKHFCEYLTKGIGKSLADSIENSIIEWWSMKRA